MEKEREHELNENSREDAGVSPPGNAPMREHECECVEYCLESLVGNVHAVVFKLMNMVNDADQLLPPRVVEGVMLTADHPFSYAIRQNAANVRAKLLEALALLGVEPMQVVGTDVDYVRHDGGGDRPTKDPACHNKVAACLLTGFTKGGEVIHKPLVEVFQYQKSEQEGEISPQEEG